MAKKSKEEDKAKDLAVEVEAAEIAEQAKKAEKATKEAAAKKREAARKKKNAAARAKRLEKAEYDKSVKRLTADADEINRLITEVKSAEGAMLKQAQTLYGIQSKLSKRVEEAYSSAFRTLGSEDGLEVFKQLKTKCNSNARLGGGAMTALKRMSNLSDYQLILDK